VARGLRIGHEPPPFSSVSFLGSDASAPHTTSGQYFVLDLHASGGSNTTAGTRYSAACSALLADPDGTDFLFGAVRGTAVGGVNVTLVGPVANYGTFPSAVRKESYWMGFRPASVAARELMTEASLDAQMVLPDSNVPNCSTTQRYCRGGSMGAWGTMTYATRRPERFAAIYPDRPRVRSNGTAGAISVPEWTTSAVTYNPSSGAPNIAAAYGSGSVKDHMDLVAYVADTGNQIPWIGWCIGSADGFSVFADHIALVAALRTARRGFAFAWNAGNHTTGSIQSEITQSYPYGLFKLGEGYPLFENHSLDDDPSVDAAGGINIGLTFRNVSESASAWSCEVKPPGALTVVVPGGMVTLLMFRSAPVVPTDPLYRVAPPAVRTRNLAMVPSVGLLSAVAVAVATDGLAVVAPPHDSGSTHSSASPEVSNRMSAKTAVAPSSMAFFSSFATVAIWLLLRNLAPLNRLGRDFRFVPTPVRRPSHAGLIAS